MSVESRMTTGPLHLTIGLAQSDPKKFADAFAESMECYGCAIIGDHGIDQTFVDKVQSQYLPHVNEPIVGKTTRELEVSRHVRPFDITSSDCGLIWHAERDYLKQINANGVWQECPDSFQGPVSDLFTELGCFGRRMLAAVAQFLWLSENWFEEPMRNNNDVMQLIGVPPKKSPNSHLLGASNGDIISLILTKEGLDLEFQHRWHSEIKQQVTLKGGDVLVITGKMLQRMTNDILKPPACQMIGTRGPQLLNSFLRFSLPFRDDFTIRSIAECVDWKDYPDRYPVPVAARDLRQMIASNHHSPV